MTYANGTSISINHLHSYDSSNHYRHYIYYITYDILYIYARGTSPPRNAYKEKML
ncbi:hypothetical protein Syun_002202 [Stephania yunnanensis]|uniref:Uncharacterized protein n=1 Tax=Stephania yunnanensis TaxID=152371 RepID=A0AAP0Q6Z4_9MAGN